jgi:hypothetical protein
MPLFDEETFLRYATSTPADPAIFCIKLCVFALGAASDDQILYHKNSTSLPGLPCFEAANKLLDVESGIPQCLLYVQCRVLLALVPPLTSPDFAMTMLVTDRWFRGYWCLLMRPLQAWRFITQAARDLMILLKIDWRAESPEFINAIGRTYWVLFVMETSVPDDEVFRSMVV